MLKIGVNNDILTVKYAVNYGKEVVWRLLDPIVIIDFRLPIITNMHTNQHRTLHRRLFR